ncbi:MAG: DUF1634 domain-containing protein [Acidobacteria bacterium]|nr:DUF1634 domain-containing protein [Acidobacteriota bacterium]
MRPRGADEIGARRQGDLDLELLIGRLLRIGVRSASACLAAGLVLQTLAPPAAAWALAAGLLILIATPAARVVLSIVEYAAERDWMFAGLTALVLAELLAGAVAALVFHRAI